MHIDAREDWVLLCKKKVIFYQLLNAKTFVLLTGCEDGESSCPRGRINSGTSCIPESFVCDGIEDCIGGTDEMNCTGPSKIFIGLVPRPHPAHIL